MPKMGTVFSFLAFCMTSQPLHIKVIRCFETSLTKNAAAESPETSRC
jgi:hypothetical protein